MKTNLLRLFLFLLLSVASISTSYAQYSGGSGSTDDPYQISSLQDLVFLSSDDINWDKSFVLTNDIDASTTTTLNNGLGFTPIGSSSSNYFSGSFDGANYTISGLTINISTENSSENNYVGMFGYVGEATIKRLNIKEANVSGHFYVGIMAGYAKLSDFHLCSVDGSVIGEASVGGFVGFSTSSFNRCSSSGSVNEVLDGATTVVNIGGFVGNTAKNAADSISFNNCYSTATVQAYSNKVGGFAGNFAYVGSKGSYATGDVTGGVDVGGFVGYMSNSIYETSLCFATGNVSGENEIGGFVGRLQTGNVNQCYAYGATSYLSDMPSDIGAFAGLYYTVAEKSYFANDNSGTNVITTDADKSTAVGISKTSFSSQSSFSGWDFTDDWEIGSLSQQGLTETLPYPLAFNYDFSIEGAIYPEDIEGIAVTPSSKYANAGSNYSITVDPANNGTYVFRGWYIDDELVSTDITYSFSPIENMSFVAKFSADYSGGGIGSESSPFILKTTNDILLLSSTPSDWDKHFKLDNDIDVTSLSSENSGAGIAPIGNNDTYFTGSFDGGDYTISNLNINRLTESYVGLFGIVEGASIHNLIIKDAIIKGRQYVGTLVANALEDTEVKFCSVVNTQIECSYSHVGGLIGQSKALVTECNVSGSINGNGNSTYSVYAGGFIGFINTSSTTEPVVSYSYANVKIEGFERNYIGGFAGKINNSAVSNCYASGDIKGGGNYVGGFAGDISMGSTRTSSFCFATGKVSTDNSNSSYVGGFTGRLYSGTLDQAYAYGEVSSDNTSIDNIGAFSGSYGSSAVLLDVFYVNDNDSTTEDASGSTATGMPKADFSDQSSFTDWDFTNDWVIDNNSPSTLPALLPYQLAFSFDLNVQVEIYPETLPDTVVVIANQGWGDVQEYTLTAPDIEASYGFTFDGWYTTSGTLYSTDATIKFTPQNSVTYVAHYSPVFITDGLGSDSDPFIINTFADINALSFLPDYWDKSYLVGSDDIDASASSTVNNGAGLSPIGTEDVPFSGSFDGNNKSISGLVINRSNEDYVGLFGYTSEAIISNVVIDEADIKGANYTAALVGYAEGGTFTYSTVNATVDAAGEFSGVFAGSANSLFTRSSTTGTINSSGNYTGGFIGQANTNDDESQSLQFCYADVQVNSGAQFVGGFAGSLNLTAANSCYAKGDVTGNQRVGGFAGEIYQTRLETSYCFSLGDVTCDVLRIGGFAYSVNGGTLNQCYAYGVTNKPVTDTESGAFVGVYISEPLLKACYFTNDEGITIDSATEGLTGMPKDDFSDADNFDWNFSTEWTTLAGFGNDNETLPYPAGYEADYFVTVLVDPDYVVTTDVISGQYGWVVDGQTYTATAVDQASGLVFQGWLDADSAFITKEKDLEYIASGDTTYTALYTAEYSGGGSGSEEDPYIIKTINDIKLLTQYSNDWDKNFVVANNIDLTETNEWRNEFNEIVGFSPIGNNVQPFTGSFDGGGFELQHMFINQTEVDTLAMFGVVGDSASISNLSLTDVDITGGKFVAGLVAYLNDANITSCSVTGSVKNDEASSSYGYLGGLVAYQNAGLIDLCRTEVEIDQAYNYVGGLVGYSKARISNSNSRGEINAYQYIGGLVGYLVYNSNYPIQIENSYSLADVNVMPSSTGGFAYVSNVGGLAGGTGNGSKISKCYAAGDVLGATNVGGFIGSNYSDLEFCFAAGSVKSGSLSGTPSRFDKIGGFVGNNSGGDIIQNYSYGAVIDKLAASNVGAFIGYSNSRTTLLEDNYFNNSNANAYTSDSHEAEGLLTGLTTDEFSNSSNFTWEFGVDWLMKVNSEITDNIIPTQLGIDYDMFIGYEVYPAGISELSITGDQSSWANQGDEKTFTAELPDDERFSFEGWYVNDELVTTDMTVVANSGDTYLAKYTYAYSGGDGSQTNPYLISDFTDLKLLSALDIDYDKHFKQTAFVNASITQQWIEEGGFSPIGINEDSPFTGTYNGDGNTISGLYISREATDNQGLFGIIGGSASITNLNVTDANITGLSYVGVIVGNEDNSSNVTLYNCNVTKSQLTSFSNAAGLLAGALTNGSISNCNVVGSIDGKQNVGLLVGNHNPAAPIDSCSATGTILARDNVGGLVGNNGGVISNSYANAQIEAESNVGGFVGSTSTSSEISNCFSVGSINRIKPEEVPTTIVESYVGAFVGDLNFSTTVTNVYSASVVTGDSYGLTENGTDGSQNPIIVGDSLIIGAFYGNSTGISGTPSLTSVYADATLFDDPSTIDRLSYGNITGLATTDFANEANFVGWDFTDVWQIIQIDEFDDAARPYLKTIESFNFSYGVEDLQMGSVSSSHVAGNYMSGEEITLTFTANENYIFEGWYDNGTLISNDAEYTFNLVNDVDLVAKATTPRNLSFSIDPSEAGVINSNYPQGSVPDGSSVTLEFVANTGFLFNGWYDVNDNLISSSPSFTFSITEDTELFAKTTPMYNFSIVEENPNAGTVVSSVAQGLNSETEIVVTYEPNANYAFVGWYINNELVSTEKSYSFYLDEDVTILARSGALVNYTYRLQTGSEGKGTITSSHEAGPIAAGTSITVEFVPENGCEFVGWFTDPIKGFPTIISSENPYTFEITSDTTLNAKASGVATSIDKVDDVELNVYPNPASSQIQVESSKVISIVSIYSLNGSLVKQVNVNASSTTLNVSDLTQGLYIVKVEDKVVKLIIKR